MAFIDGPLIVESRVNFPKYLGALAHNEILALVIPMFRSPVELEIDLQVIGRMRFEGYRQEPTLFKGGPTVYDFENNESAADDYYDRAGRWNTFFRECSRPYSIAIDECAALLGQHHPAGMRSEPLHPGRIPSLGVIRRFQSGSFAGPHSDRTDFDWPDNATAATQSALFSAVIYHRVADFGGTLKVYNRRIGNPQEFQDIRRATRRTRSGAASCLPIVPASVPRPGISSFSMRTTSTR